VSYYRFLGVAARIFPADPRRRGKGDADLDRRSPGLVAPREVLILLAGVPFWFALAWLCWRWLGRRQTTLDIDDRWWQLMVVGWLFGLVAVATSALLRYSGQAQMRPEEAKMLLQDIVWRETSREQRSISRWIAWARRRSRRKGDI
jgi:hypothetical protein